MPPRISKSDANYLTELKAAQVVDALPGVNLTLYFMLIVILAAMAWATTTRVDVVTRAEARVVPDGKEQVIASLEGGILGALMVREGQKVTAGQELARIDPTRFESQLNEDKAKQTAMKAMQARLLAEATGAALKFAPEVQSATAAMAAETASYQARQRLLQETVSANRRSIEFLQRELSVAQTMASKGLMSEVEVMRLRRQINDLQLQTQERINRHRQEASAELVRVQTELGQLTEQMSGRADVLRRTVIKSPVNGWVKNIRAVTLGGVISPGGSIMEIVPMGSRVLIEARIKPADIGFVRVGQEAQVKLAAFDFTTYGGLKGVVEYISPDALGDAERSSNPESATYYRALVRAEKGTIHARGKDIQVMPGMTATVEVKTGERSILSFLLRPMLKSKEAFRE